MQRISRVHFVIVAALILANGSASIGGEPDKPNIVFFLVDDLGWQDTSVSFWKEKTPFQDHFRTPNVERLARQGIRFTNAYSCAVCSPTRTSIMTGQNAARHGVTNWTFDPNQETSGTTNRLLPPKNWNRNGLQPGQLTLPLLLRTAGYKTIHCGKAHWGAFGTAGADPTKLGFDVNIAGHHAGAPGSYQGQDNYGNDPDKASRNRWAVPGLEKYHGTETHLTDALAREACLAIESSVKESKPFFLYMAPYAVHTPIQPHPRFIENYRGRKYPGTEIDIPEVEAQYASMVEGYDDALGQIFAKLEQLNERENTIVVFTSDNGGLSAHARGKTPRGTGANTHCWPLREGKGSSYEGGVRVPMIVSWAKEGRESSNQHQLPIKAGSKSEASVICEDYLPTICNWAGVDIDNSIKKLEVQGTINTTDVTIDGVDITPAVTAKGKLPSRKLFFHYPHIWGPRGAGYQPHSSMRAGKHKLIYFYHSRRWEMYDLENDIGETRNLVFKERKRFDQLSRIMFSNEGLVKYGFEKPEPVQGTQYVSARYEPSVTIEPVASSEDRAAAAGWTAGGTWLDQHEDINAIANNGDIDIVFLGDSITQSWGGPGRKISAPAATVWDKYYSKHKAVNFGISGDRTQNVLWRIENGNFDRINPKVIVVLIGTNNLRDSDPADVARGIEQVVLHLEEKRKRTKILLMGILPRGKEPDDSMRLKTETVNRLIAPLADNHTTYFIDIASRFLDDDGLARGEFFQDDFLHLSVRGYEEWAAAIEPDVERLLNNSHAK